MLYDYKKFHVLWEVYKTDAHPLMQFYYAESLSLPATNLKKIMNYM